MPTYCIDYTTDPSIFRLKPDWTLMSMKSWKQHKREWKIILQHLNLKLLLNTVASSADSDKTTQLTWKWVVTKAFFLVRSHFLKSSKPQCPSVNLWGKYLGCWKPTLPLDEKITLHVLPCEHKDYDFTPHHEISSPCAVQQCSWWSSHYAQCGGMKMARALVNTGIMSCGLP